MTIFYFSYTECVDGLVTYQPNDIVYGENLRCNSPELVRKCIGYDMIDITTQVIPQSSERLFV